MTDPRQFSINNRAPRYDRLKNGDIVLQCKRQAIFIRGAEAVAEFDEVRELLHRSYMPWDAMNLLWDAYVRQKPKV